MNDIDLVEAERRSFRAATDTGLWDILIASVLSMLAIGPLLSVPLGDFWAAAVFIPVWAGVCLGVWVVHRRVVAPRVGRIRFGADRQRRLRRMGVVGVVVNVVALVVGIYAAVKGPGGGEWSYPIGLSLVMLVGFSLAAYSLDIPRYFIYGMLLAVAPLMGEMLFRRGYVSHHGYPVVFGMATILITAGGIIRFIRVVPVRAPLLDATEQGAADE